MLPCNIFGSKKRRGAAAAGIMSGVPMRMDCRHYESRTYATGETVRKCNLDLAPEAPWRCPADCPQYRRKLADATFTHGTLVSPPTPPEPASVGDGTVGALLDEAEEIVNAAAPEIMADFTVERRPWWRRLFKRGER